MYILFQQMLYYCEIPFSGYHLRNYTPHMPGKAARKTGYSLGDSGNPVHTVVAQLYPDILGISQSLNPRQHANFRIISINLNYAIST